MDGPKKDEWWGKSALLFMYHKLAMADNAVQIDRHSCFHGIMIRSDSKRGC